MAFQSARFFFIYIPLCALASEESVFKIEFYQKRADRELKSKFKTTFETKVVLLEQKVIKSYLLRASRPMHIKECF